MRVAVTGAGGFIGRPLVRQLAEAGHGVTSIARRASPPPGAERHCAGDVRAEEMWHNVGPVEAVVHLAGLSDASLSRDRPLEYNAVNAFGTLVALEAARRLGALFVLASSQRVYRARREPLGEEDLLEPVDPYGYSKLVAEQWVAMYRRLFGLPTIVLRFFSVYGPGQMPGGGSSGVVALFMTRALRGDALVVHGRAWRDFTYVADVISGIRLALESARAVGGVYNIATGAATATEELARAVVAVTGSPSTVRAEDGNQPGESFVANIARAQQDLGYQPVVPLREGLERYAQWLRGQR